MVHQRTVGFFQLELSKYLQIKQNGKYNNIL